MKVVSLELKKLGLDPTIHNIVHIEAIVANTEIRRERLPRYEAYISQQLYAGQAYGLALNSSALNIIATKSGRQIPVEGLATDFQEWIFSNGYSHGETITFIGDFNDKLFLNYQIPSWKHKIRCDFFDVIPLFTRATDPCRPTLQVCCDRAGLNYDPNNHCELMVRLLWAAFGVT